MTIREQPTAKVMRTWNLAYLIHDLATWRDCDAELRRRAEVQAANPMVLHTGRKPQA